MSVAINNFLFIHCLYENEKEKSVIDSILQHLNDNSRRSATDADHQSNANIIQNRLINNQSIESSNLLAGLFGEIVTRNLGSDLNYRLANPARLFLSPRFLYSIIRRYITEYTEYTEYNEASDFIDKIFQTIYFNVDKNVSQNIGSFFYRMYNEVYNAAAKIHNLQITKKSSTNTEKIKNILNELEKIKNFLTENCGFDLDKIRVRVLKNILRGFK